MYGKFTILMMFLRLSFLVGSYVGANTVRIGSVNTYLSAEEQVFWTILVKGKLPVSGVAMGGLGGARAS